MGSNATKRNTKHTARNVWIIVLILVIILLFSYGLIASILGEKTKNDKNIIPLLYKGEREIVDEDGWSYIRVEEDPGIEASDDKVKWEANTSVDLFKNTYSNDSGEITVISDDEEKVIAPGTTNDYEFSLKNIGNVSLDYTMSLDSAFSLVDRELPIEVRLRCGDRWLVGGDDEWAEASAIDGLVDEGTIGVNKYVNYTLEWQWPYEYGENEAKILNDLNDTIIGNETVSSDVNFELKISTNVEVTDGAVPVGPNGEDLKTPLSLWNIYRILLLGSILGFIFILIFLWRTPIYFAGFITAPGKEFKVGNKKDTVRVDGRVIFKKVYMGKRKLELSETQGKCTIKLARKNIDGIEFEKKDDILKIYVGRKVRAIELYMLAEGPVLNVRQDKWAAIDKDRNVITESGVTKPVNDCNVTPGGLQIDKKNNVGIDIL